MPIAPRGGLSDVSRKAPPKNYDYTARARSQRARARSSARLDVPLDEAHAVALRAIMAETGESARQVVRRLLTAEAARYRDDR